MELLPVPVVSMPPPIPARGKQLRDLTQDALAIFKRKKFNPVEEFVNVYMEIKELGQELEGKREDYIKQLMHSIGQGNDTETIKNIVSILEADTEIQLQAKRLKFDVIKELIQYAAPKLRSTEHTGEINTGIQIFLGVKPKDEKTLELREDSRTLGREDND